MIARRIALFSVMACGFFSVAQADTYNRYVGQYYAVNAGASYAHRIKAGASESGFLGAGGSILLGQQINPYFAPEAGFSYFSFGSNGGLTIVSVSARITAPVGSNVSLFGKIGAAYSELTTRTLGIGITAGDFVPAFGLGMGVGFSPTWMATLEANGVYFPVSTKNGNGPMGGVTLGVTHYFLQ